ncbi:von Willebrand factor A domain-containing protein 7 [Amia ocellicauda]|uniref:von Willebrand factor A domain-containing protein 7 n=1 Tax=Amia ocellicauda TaxID=2972642 RepID=UPI003463DDCA
MVPSLLLWCLCLGFLLVPGAWAFFPNFVSRVLGLTWNSYTHQYITERALLLVTQEILATRPGPTGDDIHLHGELTAGDLFRRFYGYEETVSCRQFWQAVGEVVQASANVDFDMSTKHKPQYHFDSERVQQAMELLQRHWKHIQDAMRAGDHQGARKSLGQLLHSLQDFYSHSNWVEMGYRTINPHLLSSQEYAPPVAPESMQTCRDCKGLLCRNNILESINHNRILTTGYDGTDPKKPSGKCSHGGVLDPSRSLSATGGINKDTTSIIFSPHYYLHEEAAHLATNATVAVLQDLRDTVGDSNFLKLLNVGRYSALVFVIDTTGSMFDEISAARQRAQSIIKERQGTVDEPATYMLVPFHDPGVGPVQETEDPDEFMHFLGDLMALGGGDEPEMCLSAIHLALLHSPPLSEIYVFTDASPKDRHLQSTVEGLILEKHIKVTFLLTEDPSRRMKREVLSPDRFLIYTNLSALSGGLAVFTNDRDIQSVSALVQDNMPSSKVTLLHIQKEASSSSSTHSFYIDSTVNNTTIHVVGTLRDFILHNPSGQNQSLFQGKGDLATMQSYEGLSRIILFPPLSPGEWQIEVLNQERIMVNVIGQSSVDFLYHFAVAVNGTHPGLSRVEGSPVAGVPTFLLLTVTGLSGSDGATFSHVTLQGAKGESLLRVVLNSSSSLGEFLGEIPTLPTVPFSVRLTGQDRLGGVLERVSTEMIQAVHVQLQVLSSPQLWPGKTSKLWFDICNWGPARAFLLTTTDDRGFVKQRDPQQLSVGQNGTLRGSVELETPHGAEVGSAATMSLSVRSLDHGDANFAVVHLSVIDPDPDLQPPSCSPAQVQGSCPSLSAEGCGNITWSASLRLSDHGRSGLASVQISRGRGWLRIQGDFGIREGQHRQGGDPLNLTDSSGTGVAVSYSSNCCSTEAELLLWDAAGNLQHCSIVAHQQREQAFTNTASVVLLLSCLGLLLL